MLQVQDAMSTLEVTDGVGNHSDAAADRARKERGFVERDKTERRPE